MIENSKPERKAAKTHFSQKINMKNAKIKFLQGQQNLSLLINQSQSDNNRISNEGERSLVKVPGADYKRAVKYLEDKNHEIDVNSSGGEFDGDTKSRSDYINSNKNSLVDKFKSSIEDKRRRNWKRIKNLL